MSNAKYHRGLLAVLILYSVLSACAKPPTEEMIRAEKTIEDARQKQADIYAPEMFGKAEGSFQEAKELVSARKYEQARQKAIDTVKLAEQAGTVAVVNKEKERQRVMALQEEAAGLRQDIRNAIDEMRSLEKSAFRRRSLKKYEELQERISAWEAVIANSSDDPQEDRMRQITNELKQLLEEIGAAKQEVQSALIKRKK